MIIDSLTKKAINKMSDEEVNFWFQKVQNEDAANKMRKVLTDMIEVEEAQRDCNVIKIDSVVR